MFTKIWCSLNRGCTLWSEKIQWILELWSNEGPSGDWCWWMDVLLLFVGIRTGLTSDWIHERKIRTVCQSLLAINVIVFCIQFYEDMNAEDVDPSLLIMEVTKLAGISISCMRMVAAGLLIEPITALRNFVSGNSVNSGDVENDDLEQRKFNGSARRAMKAIFIWISMDTVLFAIPSSTKDELFRFPYMFAWVGETASSVLNFIIVTSIAVSVLPKTVGCTGSIGVILIGMRTKLRLLAHRFEKISQNPTSNDEHCIKRINEEIREALLQHLEYWSKLEILKDLIAKVFPLVHYFAIFAIGAMFYVCREMRISFMTVVYIAGAAFSLSEYYLLCYLIDSLQDEADSVEQHILELCARIPFSPELRSEYVQLRTTLMIIWINTRNGIAMDCNGLFEINTPQFVAVIDVAYTVLTFLIQMD